MGHLTWNCRFLANDVPKEKFKDRPHITNVAIVEYPLDVDSSDDLTKEREFYTF
jgi:hypothetical protein